MTFYFLCSLFTTLFLGVPLIKIFLTPKNHDNLLFLILCNGIFMISTTMFYFDFKELYFAFFSSIFLFIYSILLSNAIKKERPESTIFLFPYLCFTFCTMINFLIMLFFKFL